MSSAIKKVFGTETEYGFVIPGMDADEEEDDTDASLLRHPIIPQRTSLDLSKHVSVYDFFQYALHAAGIPYFVNVKRYNDYSQLRRNDPMLRASLRSEAHGMSIEEDLFRISGLSGAMLANGARFYVDMEHPEYSSPECTSARELVAWHRAGDLLMRLGTEEVRRERSVDVHIHKDNSDRHGDSYAAHENYLVESETFEELMSPDGPRSFPWETFLIVRQLFAGSGKVGCEDIYCKFSNVPFQLSQRADFMTCRHHLDTTRNRAIINTRDRPYVDERRFRRLHVIVGDANMADTALWLKVGISEMVLKMLEDDFAFAQHSFLCIPLRDSVRQLKNVSHDVSLKRPLLFVDGREATSLVILREFQRLLELYVSDAAEASPEERDLLKAYDKILSDLERISREGDKALPALFGVLDWPTKYVLCKQLESKGVPWNDIRMQIRDQDYHDLDPERGWRTRLEISGLMKRLVSDEEIERALGNPPATTRAYLRGKCVRHLKDYLARVHWGKLEFFFPAKRLPEFVECSIGDPLQGTKEMVDDLFARYSAPEEFVQNLLKKMQGQP